MMNMMTTTGYGLGGGLFFFWLLHIAAVLAFTIGLAFLVLYAFKKLTDADLKKWGWSLVIIGSVVCLLTIGAIGRPWGGFGAGAYGMGSQQMQMMERMMEEMEEHNDGSDADDREEHDMMRGMMRMMMGSTRPNGSAERAGSPQMGGRMGSMMNDDHDGSMTMDDMVSDLEGKTGDAFDMAFIAGMIPHHQGAIDMAREALDNAKHEEIKQMARDIIEAQQREIDQMRQWMRDWGYTE